MKTSFTYAIIGLCLLCSCFISAQQVEGNDMSPFKMADDTMSSYFYALKNGDVNSIKNLIAGEMLENYRVLLEKNKSYPDYLRNYYKDVEFRIGEINFMGDDISVSAIIDFPGNESARSGYILRRNIGENQSTTPSDGGWKIISQFDE